VVIEPVKRGSLDRAIAQQLRDAAVTVCGYAGIRGGQRSNTGTRTCALGNVVFGPFALVLLLDLRDPVIK
jgi:hypothetical protein